jgi:E3 ubiquitin-protein ligase HECTD3
LKKLSGETVELFEGGGLRRVRWEDRLGFCEECEARLIAEFEPQLLAMREGLNLILPPAISGLFTGPQLELLACGDQLIPVSELKQICQIEDDPGGFADQLWTILERFTPHERMLFLRFVAGRSGLPPPGHNWGSHLTIKFLRRFGDEDSEAHLPKAITCSSTLLLPLYSTIEIMEKKIRTAITFSGDIETDRAANRSELVPLA